ncbi:hypothetical protein [Nocardia farcinica]|uniref:hypothetical protein n=1 Tax=Nocardia farcinica TaxID=37329 RepID=UPI003434E2BF
MSNSNGYRSRAYELWTDERNAELVELLRAGLPEDVIAERIGRSVGALQAQCRNMIPSRERIPREDVVPGLADLVADPGFDWRERLRELARRAARVGRPCRLRTRLIAFCVRGRHRPS